MIIASHITATAAATYIGNHLSDTIDHDEDESYALRGVDGNFVGAESDSVVW
eukprot:CAMPEP_0197045824 /NCGR_PEP_ID=MMETSP1384-20130603/21616_1 /TAXON_ID=29189 /ORGANISM="Ammonia sp." /LENGTH=51 /DNA_ID=CAMNT_0042477493 /DNA_START=101 /DNA_END=253 /DNA_ORIENTATION=-